jgi:hypothetical protein
MGGVYSLWIWSVNGNRAPPSAVRQETPALSPEVVENSTPSDRAHSVDHHR